MKKNKKNTQLFANLVGLFEIEQLEERLEFVDAWITIHIPDPPCPTDPNNPPVNY